MSTVARKFQTSAAACVLAAATVVTPAVAQADTTDFVPLAPASVVWAEDVNFNISQDVSWLLDESSGSGITAAAPLFPGGDAIAGVFRSLANAIASAAGSVAGIPLLGSLVGALASVVVQALNSVADAVHPYP